MHVIECLVEGGCSVEVAHEEDGADRNPNDYVEHGQSDRKSRTLAEVGSKPEPSSPCNETDQGNQEGEGKRRAKERAERSAHTQSGKKNSQNGISRHAESRCAGQRGAKGRSRRKQRNKAGCK